MNIRQFALSSTLAAVILGGPVAAARAQDAEPEFINVGSYAIAFPLGDTHDFVPNMSWFGANWEGQWRYKPKTSVGVSLGLQDFFNQSRGTTTFSSGAVTGQQSRELLLGTIMEQEQIASTAAKLAKCRARAPLVLGCTVRARLPCWSKVA